MTAENVPNPICSDTAPHVKHRIAGTWRMECPGVEGAPGRAVSAFPNDNRAPVAGEQVMIGTAYFVGPARNRVTPADASTRTDADALRDTRNHHQGSGIVHAADADHARELRRKGLIGPRGGLTRRGSIAAERLRGASLDDAFGPL
jgi:hypothetical protein